MINLFRTPPPVRGVLALYDNPESLLRAAAQVHGQGFKDVDAYTPYAVHGLSEALGIKKSWVPYVTLVMGLSGAVFGLLFQIWTSAIDWPINVGGKPMVSLPAFVPVTFEFGVLLGGTATLAALLVACGLPDFRTPILDRDLTNDRFALFIPEDRHDWNETRAVDFLTSTHALDVRVIHG